MTIKHQPFLLTKKIREWKKNQNTRVSRVRRAKKRERESRHMIAMNNPILPRPTLPVNKTH
jgi:hypothetical protein